MSPRVSPSRECSDERRAPCVVVALLCGITRVGSISILAAVPALVACAPKLDAGQWQCAVDAGSAGAPSSTQTDPVPVPWSDGFEEGFCGYLGEDSAGYCYGYQPYVLVSEPHLPGGHFAAEFKVLSDKTHNQTRCVRQGEFPLTAFYGAYYYIPQPPSDGTVWNLWHFQGGDDPGSQHDLWDVSLAAGTQPGKWELMVLDRPSGFENYYGTDHVTIPIGSWFHIELLLKRASDGTGEIALYQDGLELFHQRNLKSEASKFVQWYVGDWVSETTPPEPSSLYVDDLSIRAMRSPVNATP